MKHKINQSFLLLLNVNIWQDVFRCVTTDISHEDLQFQYNIWDGLGSFFSGKEASTFSLHTL